MQKDRFTILLSPKSYQETRYRIFKDTGNSPMESFADYEIMQDDKIVYCRSSFTTGLYTYYQKSKQRKKTFISEGLKNGTLTLL